MDNYTAGSDAPTEEGTTTGRVEQVSAHQVGPQTLALLQRAAACDENELRAAWSNVEEAGISRAVSGLLGMCLVVAVKRYFSAHDGTDEAGKLELAERAGRLVLKSFASAVHQDVFSLLVLLGDGRKEFAPFLPPDLRALLTSMLVPVLADASGISIGNIVERSVYLMELRTMEHHGS